MPAVGYERGRRGSSDEGESHVMSVFRAKPEDSDMIDELSDGEEEERDALLSTEQESSFVRTEIDRWALACLLLQHLSK
jgi:hypothetical protein